MPKITTFSQATFTGLLAIVLSLVTSTGFAQGGLLLKKEMYSPAMDSTYELWLDMHLAHEENCKVLNPCTTTLQPEYIGIPYRLYFDNSSTLNQVDSLSVINTIHSAFALYSGYKAVPAAKYDGPITDTLFVAMEVKDTSYRLAMEFSIVQSLRTPYPSICVGGRNGEHYTENIPDSVVLEPLLTDFRFGSLFYADLHQKLDCYFERRKWPFFRDFDKRSRHNNHWYNEKYPNGKQ